MEGVNVKFYLTPYPLQTGEGDYKVGKSWPNAKRNPCPFRGAINNFAENLIEETQELIHKKEKI